MASAAERGLPEPRGGSSKVAQPHLLESPTALAAGLAATALALHSSLWGLQAPLGRSVVAGVLLLAAGLGWLLWAAWALRPAVFTDEGPFRLGRNPMYLGMVTALLGLSLLLGVPLLAAAAGALATVLHRVHIPQEESQLRRSFGGWYSDYAASVRRWL